MSVEQVAVECAVNTAQYVLVSIVLVVVYLFWLFSEIKTAKFKRRVRLFLFKQELEAEFLEHMETEQKLSKL